MRTEQEIRDYIKDLGLDEEDVVMNGYGGEGEQAAIAALKWVLEEGDKW